MKALKIVMVLIVAVCILPALTVKDGHAASAGWYICTVNQAGTSYSSQYLQLTDTSGAFTQNWFLLFPASANQMLASALTALSSGMKVQMYYDGTQILVIYAIAS